MKVVIVDYGMGNVRSIVGALRFLGFNNVLVSNKTSEIKSADKFILPGVGSFPSAIANIKKLKIDKLLTYEVLVKKKPILGICLGMQLMCKNSSECGANEGLGFINGTINRFKCTSFPVPHIGFNQVVYDKESKLFSGIANSSDFYFVHSFKMDSNSEVIKSICNYENSFISSYEVGNIAGVQFHPELSQTNGLKLIRNFLEKF
jgi:glutamine amidotransferase